VKKHLGAGLPYPKLALPALASKGDGTLVPLPSLGAAGDRV
jgi:hypothetical protein